MTASRETDTGERDRRERAERLFEEARALEPGARAARIDELCRGDEALRAELQSLLAHADAAENFFALLGRAVIPPDLTGGLVAGRYRIHDCIGAGGMGSVYRAHDRVLEREVALKFLDGYGGGNAHAQARLLREARAAAALEHSNVCTVHEVGETEDGRPFISMALYEGQTLKERLVGGPLPVGEAVDITRQIARGLRAAHTRGLVHRDVKPGNVMLVQDGVVKLLDFGLARSSDASLTLPAATPGTVAYMSPEQVRGEALHPRSDLFSLGIVFQEMLTGVNPFRRGNDQAAIQAILHDEPEPIAGRRPGVSPALQRVVTRLLRKRPEARYADAGALIADLDRVASQPGYSPATYINRLAFSRRPALIATLVLVLIGAAAAAIRLTRGSASPPPPETEPTAAAFDDAVAGMKTIAVLPFTNVNRDAEQDYLVDGLTEELIGALSRIRSLRVVARTSAFTFRGATRDIREIGRALNAGTIVEGSVQTVGENIRVRAQLINVADGLHLWSKTYDHGMTDILALQRDLALRIAAELEAELSAAERERLARRATTSPEAYGYYLKGRHFWNQRTPAAFTRAIEYYQRAIDADPEFAAAHAGLAASYSLQGIWSELAPVEARARMRAAALRAVELDDGSAEAHSALGVYLHVYEWDTQAAEREQLRAIELDPRSVTPRFFYANLLRANGRLEEAITQYRVAVALDPLDPNATESLGTALLLAGRLPEALEQLTSALELDSMFWRPNMALGEYHELTGNHQEALRLFERGVALQGSPIYRARVDYSRTLALMGREAEARHRLDELQAEAERTGSHEPLVATLFLALNDLEGALAWLERSYRERHPKMRFIGGMPLFRPFEADPRYRDLLRRVGLRG